MSNRPTIKTVACPECGASVSRTIIWFGDREFQADRGCLCDACEEKRVSAVATVTAREKHLEQWKQRAPDDYRRAAAEQVSIPLRPALDWRPMEGCRRLGLWGAPGSGKSMAAALVVRDAGLPFRWTNGFAARGLYNSAVSSDDPEKRREDSRLWQRLMSAPLLVLDDVDKSNFTEAWASALFDLLEHRNSNCLATIWTANYGPGGLAQKFSKCGDIELAQAIERRLCSGALIINT